MRTMKSEQLFMAFAGSPQGGERDDLFDLSGRDLLTLPVAVARKLNDRMAGGVRSRAAEVSSKGLEVAPDEACVRSVTHGWLEETLASTVFVAEGRGVRWREALTSECRRSGQ